MITMFNGRHMPLPGDLVYAMDREEWIPYWKIERVDWHRDATVSVRLTRIGLTSDDPYSELGQGPMYITSWASDPRQWAWNHTLCVWMSSCSYGLWLEREQARAFADHIDRRIVAQVWAEDLNRRSVNLAAFTGIKMESTFGVDMAPLEKRDTNTTVLFVGGPAHGKQQVYPGDAHEMLLLPYFPGAPLSLVRPWEVSPGTVPLSAARYQRVRVRASGGLYEQPIWMFCGVDRTPSAGDRMWLADHSGLYIGGIFTITKEPLSWGNEYQAEEAVEYGRKIFFKASAVRFDFDRQAFVLHKDGEARLVSTTERYVRGNW